MRPRTPSAFTDESLARYKAVVFLSTTGDVLNAAQEAAFERFIRRGGGFVGVHSAADTEYDWPFYGALVGAYFAGHPDIQNATIQIEDAAHPAMASLPRAWTRRDEWYNFQQNPRGSVNVLATLDERTYTRRHDGAGPPDHLVAHLRGRPLLLHRRRPHAGKLLGAAPSSITSGEPFSGRPVRYDFGECHLKTNRSSSAAPTWRS